MHKAYRRRERLGHCCRRRDGLGPGVVVVLLMTVILTEVMMTPIFIVVLVVMSMKVFVKSF